MKNFTVQIQEVHQTTIEIEAENKEEALKKALLILESGIMPDGSQLPDATYDFTLDPEEWEVYE